MEPYNEHIANYSKEYRVFVIIYVYFWSNPHFGATILVQTIIHMILFDS